MNPEKVRRETTRTLSDLPNIGPAIANDLRRIGIERPQQLAGGDAYELYLRLCEAKGRRQDPCLLDTLMSVVDFMNGGEPKVWWAYTPERKRLQKERERARP
ncbi:helix-hairpin-helix domain-containing protein [Sulfurimonas sp. HSL3-7]|uniref:helix-hairpin-helix domain-containing protein n=1 Tax=Sulfonitrofixus jiaomeiensis TaxID=3131938 RepID=UPI0031F8E2DB